MTIQNLLTTACILVATQHAFADGSGFQADISVSDGMKAIGKQRYIDMQVGKTAVTSPFSICTFEDGTLRFVAGTVLSGRRQELPTDLLARRSSTKTVALSFSLSANDEDKARIIASLLLASDCAALPSNVAAPELLLTIGSINGADSMSELVGATQSQ